MIIDKDDVNIIPIRIGNHDFEYIIRKNYTIDVHQDVYNVHFYFVTKIISSSLREVTLAFVINLSSKYVDIISSVNIKFWAFSLREDKIKEIDFSCYDVWYDKSCLDPKLKSKVIGAKFGI